MQHNVGVTYVTTAIPPTPPPASRLNPKVTTEERVTVLKHTNATLRCTLRMRRTNIHHRINWYRVGENGTQGAPLMTYIDRNAFHNFRRTAALGLVGRLEAVDDHASLRILRVKGEDSGTYRCEVILASQQRSYADVNMTILECPTDKKDHTVISKAVPTEVARSVDLRNHPGQRIVVISDSESAFTVALITGAIFFILTTYWELIFPSDSCRVELFACRDGGCPLPGVFQGQGDPPPLDPASHQTPPPPHFTIVDPYRECYEGTGESYRGRANYTELGFDCLFWDHEKVKVIMSPGDYRRFDLQENYCRNPFSYSRPLCFVINPHDSEHSFWDFCPIPNCYPTTTAPTTTPTAAPRSTAVKRHITPHLPRASSTTPSKGGPSPAGVTASLWPGETHSQPPSAVSRITQVTLPSGGSLQKSTDQSAVKACRLDQFQCNNDKRCISRQSVCDNLVDCSDRSDEEDCALRCAADEFFCDDLCYPAFFTCDGWADCADGSDENHANCSESLFFLTTLQHRSLVLGRAKMATVKQETLEVETVKQGTREVETVKRIRE
ncbi:LRP1B [Branchiostoma lanceolatum]|uniref:LRP1B protein n=1 Tax=Branchiostoma lanceolatum TaxID=7740 RepID=A0A8J9VRK8_BRALA|nr:LRP1B [Branchiostoma lanceolatum]